MIDLTKYTRYIDETSNQPTWRYRADREADFYDGNQLDSEILQAQEQLGIPAAIEPLIGPAIDAVLGMEVRARRDWRVVPEIGGDDLALALNEKLNKAEKQSKADNACSEAYASQVKVGVGWVETARNTDPFGYPYRCLNIHRNEIWWDWLSRQPDLSDARYLLRRKWVDVDQAAMMFPRKKKLIEQVGNGWSGVNPGELFEGGQSTDLAMAFTDERGWSIEEMEWMDSLNQRLALFELWYRTWERIIVLKGKDGSAVELNKKSPVHIAAVATGFAVPQYATVHRTNLSWWLGPHLLHDGPSPYNHNQFPYVPFWGKREDRTGVPYGLVRGMMYLQEEVNARISKMQWLLSAVRSERTKGAVLMSDAQFNNEVARPDADIILDPAEMSKPGAKFSVHRDHQLSQQQFSRLVDAREGINRVSGIYKSFQGQESGIRSGVAEQSLVEQSIQTLADINDNHRNGRMAVGDQLLSFIIEDIGDQPHEVFVKGNITRADQRIILNSKQSDEDIGTEYLDNDVQKAKMMVELSDVPSTPTFRAQQLQTLGSAMKNMPGKYQAIMMPFLIALMDLPDRDELMETIRKANDQMGPEQVEKMIKDAVDRALVKAQIELKQHDLDRKDREQNMKEQIADKNEVKEGVEATKSAIEAAEAIIANPSVAAIAEAIMEVAAGLNEDPQKAAAEIAETAVQPQTGPVSAPDIVQPQGGSVQ